MTIKIETLNNIPAGHLTDEDKALHTLGIMKTIYVPVHPFVNEIKIALGKAAAETIAMFQNPHKRTQDKLHELFFETYIEWSRSAVNIVSGHYPNQYPTSGSNEAIRESIAYHASNMRAQNLKPKIHIFNGEYEGYRAHAESHSVEVISHDRGNYEESLSQNLNAHEPFYLSAPSGIDGNIWHGYDGFLTHLENEHPDSRLMLDLAYLNTTAKTPIIRTDSSIIDAIFVSMSKSFPGTYYDRIGGVFSKSDIPGLFGNKWFKNLHGLLLGINLMMNSKLGEIPTHMQGLQTQVINSLKPTIGDDVRASDVTFIATQPIPTSPTSIQKMLTRAGQIRYCLTPSLTRLLHS